MEQPVVFEKDMDPAVKAALPCSIVKLKSGDFVALPFARAFQGAVIHNTRITY